MTQTYRIETLYTDGWMLIEEEAKNLTKEQCDLMLNNYPSLYYFTSLPFQFPYSTHTFEISQNQIMQAWALQVR